MTIEFTSSPDSTVGVELELMLVDPSDGSLVNGASTLIDDLADVDGVGSQVKHELFECTVEAVTGVCDTPDQARADLAATIAALMGAARRRGWEVASAGSHPFGRCGDQVISPDPRYHQLIGDMQWAARRLLIFGTHVHVGVPSGQAAIAVANELQRTLPLMLLLSASSPFFEGTETGMASARTKVFEGLPTAGLPPQLDDWSDFESFMTTLRRAGCIQSVREVWWDIRPHPDFGTVELRMCDAVPTLDEVATLATLAQALVVEATERYTAGTLDTRPREWTVRENKWLAARHGIEAELIVDESGLRRPATALVDELVERLSPLAERTDSVAHLERASTLVREGPGYVRLRGLGASGADGVALVRSLVTDLESSVVLPA